MYTSTQDIFEKLFGREHPNVATVLGNRAGLFEAQVGVEHVSRKVGVTDRLGAPLVDLSLGNIDDVDRALRCHLPPVFTHRAKMLKLKVCTMKQSLLARRLWGRSIQPWLSCWTTWRGFCLIRCGISLSPLELSPRLKLSRFQGAARGHYRARTVPQAFKTTIAESIDKLEAKCAYIRGRIPLSRLIVICTLRLTTVQRIRSHPVSCSDSNPSLQLRIC